MFRDMQDLRELEERKSPFDRLRTYIEGLLEKGDKLRAYSATELGHTQYLIDCGKANFF